jgi:hypothetical protein
MQVREHAIGGHLVDQMRALAVSLDQTRQQVRQAPPLGCRRELTKVPGRQPAPPEWVDQPGPGRDQPDLCRYHVPVQRSVVARVPRQDLSRKLPPVLLQFGR